MRDQGLKKGDRELRLGENTNANGAADPKPFLPLADGSLPLADGAGADSADSATGDPYVMLEIPDDPIAIPGGSLVNASLPVADESDPPAADPGPTPSHLATLLALAARRRAAVAVLYSPPPAYVADVREGKIHAAGCRCVVCEARRASDAATAELVDRLLRLVDDGWLEVVAGVKA